jgi:hypothetical protein
MRWGGILRAVETPEFLLFYVSPSCAMQIPKRAIPNAADLLRARSVIQQALGPKASLLTSS